MYRFKRDYVNLNNAVILVAFLVVANLVWSSLGVMQRNYNLQKELDDKTRQLKLAELDTEKAKLQQRYYKTNEYMELAVRDKLGLAAPGEKVLILPLNTGEIKEESAKEATSSFDIPQEKVSNFQQWMNFLFGGNKKRISK